MWYILGYRDQNSYLFTKDPDRFLFIYLVSSFLLILLLNVTRITSTYRFPLYIGEVWFFLTTNPYLKS